MKKFCFRILLALAVCAKLGLLVSGAACAYYVDGAIAVSGNGTSWSEAFKTIQEAVDAADNGDTIWVKQGTYFVTSTIDVDKSVAIYGGFDGTETQISERNWRSNVTNVDGQNTVRCFRISADAILDGFTITHGYTAWGGGGIFIHSSSPVVTNCRFMENTAGTNGGGAIHSWNASPTITNSLFLENDGGSNGGGAIFNWDCPAVVVNNCTFSNNNGGSGGGGAIYNYNSSATVTNCILWNDTADTGSEVYNEGGTLTISRCDVAGGIAGIVNAGGGTIIDDGTNIEVDPLLAYVSPSGNDNNHCLLPGSPCKTIQRAIDAAYGTETSPVTIHVAAGTYNEHLVMNSWESLGGGWNSDFTQQWDFDNDGLEPDPEYATIIDGGNNGTCITQLEVSGANINGFTIQNGLGVAGGIYLDHSHPTITYCTIRDNEGDFYDDPAHAAGGMYNYNSNPSVFNCSFQDNISEGGLDGYSAYAVLNKNSQAMFAKCSFTGKSFTGDLFPAGNGMVNIDSSPIISECRFEENHSGNYVYGPMVNINSSPVITHCSFLRNRIAEESGAAMYNLYSTVMIINSEFIGNYVADIDGDGVAIINISTECTIINSTFADNRSIHWPVCGVISNYSNSHNIIWNSIVWDNIYIFDDIPDEFGPIGLCIDDSSTLEVYYSDIDQDGFAGTDGNISQNPMFINSGWDDNGTPDPSDDVWVGGDYRLQQDSPCINTGNNSALPPDTTDLDNDGDTTEPIPFDLDGKLRIIDSIVDMGAYEYYTVCECDFPPSDGDVDGSDLAAYISDSAGITLDVLAADFGKTDCSQ